MIIKRLPNWVLTSKYPAFFDFESLTATEQTARVYAKMNEFIDAYNKYVDDLNSQIEEFESSVDKDYNCFTTKIIDLTTDYINCVHIRLNAQDRRIEEYYNAFTSDVLKTIDTMLKELKENGELDNTILESLNNLNKKFTDLHNEFLKVKSEYDTSVAEIKAEYNKAKNDLAVDYQATKTNLESDYQTAKEGVSEKLSNMDAVICGVEVDYLEDAYITIADITKCKLVNVALEDGHCIAQVLLNTLEEKTIFSIQGSGVSSESEVGALNLVVANIHGEIDSNGNCYITSNGSFYIAIAGGSETPVDINSEGLKVLSITGII